MTHTKTLVSLTTILIAAGTASADIATNGGFEFGTGGDSDAWTEFGGGAAGTVSERTMDTPIDGAWSHNLLAVGDNTVGGAAGISQNTLTDGGLASLLENTTLSYSFDAVTDYGPGGVGFYALRILNGDGAIVADTGLQMIATGSNATAVLNVPAFGGGANDTYAAYMEIVVNAGAFDGSYSNAKIDNVVLDGTLVPAPASASLIALGGLVAMRRRR